MSFSMSLPPMKFLKFTVVISSQAQTSSRPIPLAHFRGFWTIMVSVREPTNSPVRVLRSLKRRVRILPQNKNLVLQRLPLVLGRNFPL